MTNDDNNKSLTILDFDNLYQICWLIDGLLSATVDTPNQHVSNISFLLGHINQTLHIRIDELRDKALSV